MADKLLEIADASGNVTWSNVPASTDLPPGPWVFPPQNSAEKFIVRDLAMYTLASLALTDARLPSNTYGSPGGKVVCSEAYARAAASVTYANTNVSYLYENGGALSEDRFQLGQKGMSIAAQSTGLNMYRLNLEAHILRHAGRLANDTIRKSVYADLAGGEHRRALATDPKRGNALMWAVNALGSDGGDARYNSLAHAARVLEGRWELGVNLPPTVTAVSCGGVAPLELLRGAYGKDLTARDTDYKVQTEGQRSAIVAVESAGLVVEDTSAASKDGVALRKALKDQLLAAAAARTPGYATMTSIERAAALADVTERRGASIQKLVDELAEGDIRFALHRAFNHFRLLTNGGPDVVTSSLPGGLLGATPVAPTVAALGNATAVQNALPKIDLSVPMRARTGGFQEASACATANGVFGPVFTDFNYTGTFQNSFGLGQALWRRLVVLRELAGGLTAGSGLAGAQFADEKSKLVRLTSLGAAEQRAWAGPGQVAAFASGSATQMSSVTMVVQGLDLSDLGVSSLDAARDRIVLAYGEPWVADCVAGTRSTCPGDIDAYVAYPTSANYVSVADVAGGARLTGFDGVYGLLTFGVPGKGADKPVFLGRNPNLSNKHVYVVLRRDPSTSAPASATKATGKVLATLAFRAPDSPTMSFVSALQSELLDGILGIGDRSVGSASKGEESAASPPGYCLEGVPRNQFIPLENELTSDSDGFENSWKHYLDLAEKAAVKADELGEKMVQQGLASDLRREAAQEELAKRCGILSNIDELSVSGGKVVPPASGTALASCMGTDKYDVVMLTNEPPALAAITDATARDVWIRANILRCPATGPFENALCEPTRKLRFAALGIAGDYIDDRTPPSVCDEVLDSAKRVATGLPGGEIGKLGSSLFFTAGALQDHLVGTRLVVRSGSGTDFEWELTAQGSQLLSSSKTAGAWPGCQRTSATVGCDLTKNPSIARFRPIFLEGKGPTDALSDDDVAKILWRLEGALFLLGSLNGTHPAGLFAVPVPVADFNASGAPEAVPTPTLYGASRFVTTGGLSVLDISTGGTGDDVVAMNGTTGLTFRWTAGTSPLLPLWLRDLYTSSTATTFRQIVATSAAYPGFVDPDGRVDGKLAGEPLAAWLKRVGAGLSELKCTGVDGTLNFSVLTTGTYAQQNAARDIWQRKLPSSTLAVCGTPAGWGPTMLLNMDYQSDVTGSTFRDKLYYLPSKDSWSGKDDQKFKDWCEGFEGNEPERASELSTIVPMYPASSMDISRKDSGDPSSVVCGRFEDRDALDKDGGSHCGYATKFNVQQVPAACAIEGVWKLGSYKSGRVHGYKQHTLRTTLPTVCGPGARVKAFVNSYPAQNLCGQVGELLQATVLACELGSADAFPIATEAPVVNDRDDLPKLTRWLGKASSRVRKQASLLHLEAIPDSVIKDIQKGSITPGIGGDVGDARAQMQQSILGIAQTLIQVSKELDAVQATIETTYTTIRDIDLTAKKEEINNLRAQLAVYRDIADRAAKATSGLMTFLTSPKLSEKVEGAAAIGAAGVGIGLDTYELSKLGELSSIAGDEKANRLRSALNTLRANVKDHISNIDSNLLQLRKNVLEVLTIGKKGAFLEAMAQWDAAKAAGADYMTDPVSGKVVPIPVNTVQRRSYDILKIRYERALKDAKYLAYYARLAIEQRIGVRLNTLVGKVGALAPPSQWADDVCNLTGIDYSKLRTASAPPIGDAGSSEVLEANEKELISKFADQYIGDYVSKLRSFVEYYNVQYPSHEGDDIAIVSLQDDLGACFKEGPNYLLQSAHLERKDAPSGIGGWQLSACKTSDTKCLRVTSGLAVVTPPVPPVPGSGSGISWLRDTSTELWSGPTSPSPSTGPGLPDTPAPSTSPPKPFVPPNHSVGQIVRLQPGAHVLSWWDMGLSSKGAPLAAGDPVVPYRVAVVDGSGATLASYVGTPAALGTGVWSPRRSLKVSISAAGDYMVTVTSSLEGSERGSILVSNVQLERDDAGSGASAYVGTEWTRKVLTTNCDKLSKLPVQSKFEHRCEGSVCFHELTAPILIDTSKLATGKFSVDPPGGVGGKLAAENFNFRHITLAVNLVGTAVRDCSATPTASCFGSGYLEYTLTHDAYNSGVVSWDGSAQYFNFGLGAIRHGKALTAERFLTMPLGSADTGLIFTPAFEKVELRGRPLDGGYRFRIYDDPALRWERLEDVQIVLKYRYWSAIQPQPPGG